MIGCLWALILEQKSIKKIEWVPDSESSEGLEGTNKEFSSVAESVVYALLVLCVLGAVYACFEKTEQEPSFLPAAEIGSSCSEEGGLMGLSLLKTKPRVNLAGIMSNGVRPLLKAGLGSFH